MEDFSRRKFNFTFLSAKGMPAQQPHPASLKKIAEKSKY
jgi:hypothetical protein